MNLNDLAVKYGSDKHSGHHDYCGAYEDNLRHLRYKEITLLELGFGGYHYPDRGGAGMRMFHEWMPHARIVSTDLHAKDPILDTRADFYQADLSKKEDRDRIKKGEKDDAPFVIIDDASHVNHHVIDTFKDFFAWLQPGGVYVIEDLESSWWAGDFGGCPDVWDMEAWTSINMLRTLITSLNRKYIPAQGSALVPISRMDFRPNICFIHKSV